MERMNLFQDNNKPQITFYFAECMEFPDYGEYKEFPSLAQAISLFEKCPGTLLNAVKCVGFILHDDSIYDDVKQPLMTSKHVLKDDINYISHYVNTTLVQEAIKEAECYLRSKENSKSKVTTGMFDNCDPLPAEMRENFKFTDEEIRYLSGIGNMFKNDKSVNFEIMEGPMPPAPIQDENRFICFRVEGKEYSLRIVSKEEMQRVKEEVNKNSKYTYDWFKEESGNHNWVLYNTDMYEISNYEGNRYLHYIELNGLPPVVPINATSCHHMFDNCCDTKELYLPAGITNCYKMFSHLSSFTHLYNLENYSKLEVDMSCAFEGCKDLKLVRMGDAFAVGFFKVNSFAHAFQGCDHLESIDITYVSLKHADFSYAFYGCLDLKDIFVLEHFNLENVSTSKYTFEFCVNLPNFDCKNVDANSTTLVLKENGGYLTRHLEHIERIHHRDYLYLLSEINNGISIPERIKNFIDNYSYEVSEGGLSLIPEDEVDLEKRFGKYLREDVKYEE